MVIKGDVSLYVLGDWKWFILFLPSFGLQKLEVAYSGRITSDTQMLRVWLKVIMSKGPKNSESDRSEYGNLKISFDIWL